MRCFVFGLFSLIPLIGLGLAVLALWLHFKVWAESGHEWNPASLYLKLGFALALLGALVSLAAAALFLGALIQGFNF